MRVPTPSHHFWIERLLLQAEHYDEKDHVQQQVREHLVLRRFADGWSVNRPPFCEHQQQPCHDNLVQCPKDVACVFGRIRFMVAVFGEPKVVLHVACTRNDGQKERQLKDLPRHDHAFERRIRMQLKQRHHDQDDQFGDQDVQDPIFVRRELFEHVALAVRPLRCCVKGHGLAIATLEHEEPVLVGQIAMKGAELSFA